jgi:hypothetical protein
VLVIGEAWVEEKHGLKSLLQQWVGCIGVGLPFNKNNHLEEVWLVIQVQGVGARVHAKTDSRGLPWASKYTEKKNS